MKYYVGDNRCDEYSCENTLRRHRTSDYMTYVYARVACKSLLNPIGTD